MKRKRTIVKSTFFFFFFFFFNMYKKTKYACLLLSLLRLIWPRNKHRCMRACVEQERRLKRIKKHTYTEEEKKKRISTVVVLMSYFFTSAHLSVDQKKHPIKMKNKLMIIVNVKKRASERERQRDTKIRMYIRALSCSREKVFMHLICANV